MTPLEIFANIFNLLSVFLANRKYEDLLKIAKTHIANEERLAAAADRYLFIDTSPLTTLLYSEHLFGKIDPELVWLSHRRYNRTFLCAPDFPFVQDGWREDSGFRERQHEWYLRTLAERHISYILLEGDLRTRIEKVKAILQKS